MKTIHIEYFVFAGSEFILGSLDGKLCLLDFRYRKMRESVDRRLQTLLGAEYVQGGSEIIEETKKQLKEYFCMQREEFDIPLLMAGTVFQKSVWDALLKIPFGESRSYLELAQEIGNAKAVRAVANANGANAIGIIIPCHRVIGSDGSLTGYAGGLALKRKLLELENNLFS